MDFIAAPAPVPLVYGVRDSLRADPAGFDAWVEAAVGEFETRLPIPPTCDRFRSGGYFRLKKHQRSICFAPEGQQRVGNVFCIKGMEPLAPDFGRGLDQMAAQRRAGSGLSLLEYFIVREDKLPGCLLFDEANAEAAIAATLHGRLAQDGGPLARLPVPVVCVRLPEETARAAVREVVVRSSRALWPKIETLAAVGLGAYVYWYPSVPLRAAEFRPGARAAVAMSEAWIDLAARLLRAGFLPTSAHSLGRGQCCNRQNSVIDGGFVDVSSVIPLEELPTGQDVFTAVQLTIWEISATILKVLGRPLSRDSTSIARLDDAAQLVMNVVRERLVRACGDELDPRLRPFLGDPQTVESVARILDQV
jgi:hypothetical protein